METAINFIDHSQHYGNILVHCHKGVSRSISFVIGYLMKKNEMTLEEALSYVKSIRPIANPNETFLEQLQRYEQLLKDERAANKAAQLSFNTNIIGSRGEEGNERKRARIEVSGPSLPPPEVGASLSQIVVDVIGPSLPPLTGPCCSLTQADEILVECLET
jgi:hypothetical protein